MRKRSKGILLALAAVAISGFLVGSVNAEEAKKVLRAGMIGLDTSHVVAFTNVLNDPKAEGDLADIKVVAAFPGGSPDVEASASRVDGFTKKLADQGVEICDSVEQLLSKVDVVLIESVDGRPHLGYAKQVIAAKKPFFIDKPVAGSLVDGIEIFLRAEAAGVPCFSSSSTRFGTKVQEMRNNCPYGDVVGCNTWAPCSYEPHHPDLFWYGVHGSEMLFTIMGPGISTVTRTHTKDTDLVVGVWKDGRVGTFRGCRTGLHPHYGSFVFGTKASGSGGGYEGYKPMVVAMAKFFKDGVPPVAAQETIELFGFMEAADLSKAKGGATVSVVDYIAEARKKAEANIKADK
jgi:Oxidoreductase family, NAD-binding Rossmann fold